MKNIQNIECLKTDTTKIFRHETKGPIGFIRTLAFRGENTARDKQTESLFKNLYYQANSFLAYNTENAGKKNYWQGANSIIEDMQETIKKLESRELPNEIKDFPNKLHAYLKMPLKLRELSNLRNISRKELMKNSKHINLRDIIDNAVYDIKEHLDAYSLNLKTSYQGDLKLFAHPAATCAMVTTLLGDMINFAPNNSNMSINATKEKDILQLTTKNRYMEKSRNLHGTNEGLGLPYVKDVVRNMNGDFYCEKTPKFFMTNLSMQNFLPN